MKIKKAVEISDAEIQFVSLVNKAANKKRFLITKAGDGKIRFETSGRIIKTDNEAHYITGIVYEPYSEDVHGNFMTAEEIRKAAYRFAKNSDKVDIQHSFKAAEGVTVVENYIAPCDMEMGGELVRKGTWLMTAEVENPQVWEAVREGEITGFSMGGTGRYGEADVNLVCDESAGVKGRSNGVTDKAEAIACEGKKSFMKKLFEAFGFEAALNGGIFREDDDESIVSLYENGDEASSEAVRDGDVSGEDVNFAVSLYEEEKDAEILPLLREDIREAVREEVENAVAPLLKAKGVPCNLNDSRFNKASDRHFLTGII